MSSPKHIRKSSNATLALFGGAALLCTVLVARAELPDFLQHVVSASALEAALFRMMDLPGVKALYPRPPKEAQAELQKLLAQNAQQAELYSLKAREDEQALGFVAAEADWKAYAAHAKDPLQAKLQLAAYYHRRLQGPDEVQVLIEIGTASPVPEEAFTAVDKQQSWMAFSRIVALADEDAMDPTVKQHTYEAWINRYPQEGAVYANYFNWLLAAKQYDATTELVARYRTAFPEDAVFPVKATALVELRRGSVAKAMAVYDASFRPLWPQELVDSYFSLLAQTHQQRTFVGEAKARLEKNPDDFDALCRIYFYQRQSGRNDAAQTAVDQYRLAKDVRKAAWSADELYTLMSLMQRAGVWPEAARYAFALYNLPTSAMVDGRSAQETGLSAMTDILLSAPDQPLLLGAQNLTMYRDIATMDQGPGYWNGILSLWLNSSSPAQEYSSEETKAQSYFHRTKAADLLQMLDAKFPQAVARPALHARLISVYAEYGANADVIRTGNEYLQQFPNGKERVTVALQIADAYARQNDTKDELAVYDRLLVELGARTKGMPLTAAAAITSSSTPNGNADAFGADEPHNTTASIANSTAFEIMSTTSAPQQEGATEYSEVLERYLNRLVMTGQMQAALAVLRRELDRNPNDPLLYERLAQFLAQNKLGAQEEEVYKAAIAHFPDKSWYDKLARFYLREKQNEAYADLTRQVAKTFEGTDLENYFRNASGGGAQMSLQLNLYAAQRFPHDLVFLRNLLQAYEVKPTRDEAARLALLRLHWWEAEDLQTAFFETLSKSGKLAEELQQLQGTDTRSNPAAGRELAEAQIWRSHFEESASPLGALADMYPADPEIGASAASIFRSLAYYDSAQTAKAVAIEKNLLAANPGDLDRLAAIGDIYADAGAVGSTGHEDLAAAAPYWQRMAKVNPGSKDGYLQAATIFWDYFEFDRALEEIHAARLKFSDPTLFGYEAGAICEGKHDNTCAAREYAAAALESNTDARYRLLTLATRKQFVKPVEEAMETAGNTEAAMVLREDILHAQGNDAAIGPLLEAELARTTTLDDVAAIAERAHTHSFVAIYERALAKEETLAADPVQKIELQYALAASQEQRKNTADAARVMAAVYAANPRVLGVVRATVDFYWRTGSKDQAITVLADASKVARPDLSHQFTLEAASKANDDGQYALARQIVAPLLDATAFDPQSIAIVADSYARAGDDAGLRDFYIAKLAAIKTATMNADSKKQTTLLLRRGLIPALTRLRDYPGATDQYIAMLSAYPEDTSLTQEATLYALRWQQKDRLVSFVQRTATQSPKDSRFASMLAQMQTVFEDFPAAIDAWNHAVSIRADKQEWFAAKADLELRLNRLDEACADYERLYVLSYKDPQWMVAEAEVRAQQGRKQDAIAALQKAWITTSTPVASDEFRIAAQLNSWNMLPESRSFAEQGIKLAGDDLLIDNADGASTYMQIMARLRQTDAAWQVLDKSLSAANVSANSPSILAEQVQKQGIASVSNAEWRQKLAEQRANTARGNYNQALQAMAKAVSTYDTPEEKSQLAALVSKAHPHADLIQIADVAGLKDLEATLRHDALLAETGKTRQQFRPYIDLQRGRMMFLDLAHTLESYAALLSPAIGNEFVKQQAASAYRDVGDEAAELRVAASTTSFPMDPTSRERYFALLLKRDKPALFKLATQNNDIGDAATNYALSYAEEPVALQALTAHGSAMQPVWNSSYRALTGLYFGDTGADTNNAFRIALGDSTIGDRLTQPLDRSKTLAGDLWFYYGMRYAVFRLSGGPGDPEDFAVSELEHSAGFASYVSLARTYADAGKIDAALAEYRHALELQPEAASLHDAMAVLLWKAGRHNDAIAEWQSALNLLRKTIEKQMVPDDFFTTTELITRHAKEHGALLQLRASLTDLLKAYLAKNGNYRSNELLHAAFEAAPSSTDGLAWVLELSAASKKQAQILVDLEYASWLPQAVRVSFELKRLELARAAAANPAKDTGVTEKVSDIQAALVVLYVQLKDDASAKAILAQVPSARRQSSDLAVASVMLAARDGSLKTLLETYDTLPDTIQPSTDSLRQAAGRLALADDRSDARLILEFLFTRAMLRHELTSTDYLALADARLSTNDMPGALDLLRRMTLLASDKGRYANYDLAAALLEKAGHPAEAIAFLTPLAASQPWDGLYAMRLAEAQMKASQDVASAHASLATLAASPLIDYDLRAHAALDLRGATIMPLGSRELDLLAANTITIEQAKQPYCAKTRMAAAGFFNTPVKTTTAQKESLLREALAIAPDGVDADAIRIGIFHANAELGRDALAMAAIKPLLDRLQSSPASTPDTEPSGEITANADSPQQASSEATHETQTDSSESNAALLVAASDVTWRMGETPSAMQYLQAAIKLARTSPQRTAWRQKLTQRLAVVRRTQANTARRPVIHAPLDQSVAVRPRLVAEKESR